ncbi:hypothetical protein CAI21_04175 [Alkalilimnicola ehrlichii]|uniref:Flagellar protein FliT n=1 Tax=Alkalilimnicola ehrlichii TaxID=351052 RepID=A0A3E0X1Y0_9GAMM|nr:hypothetical protein [Alkalilimnicola ehrlichii]RFA30714.1 hypothetical protein CAI21_04175 [Alkalilimnicola ehrlichii]RFA38291.1 hypothetical protein CAL65_05540 [Alkalilimnicola ehrlichii]
MPPGVDAQRLQALHRLLEQALATGDWTQIGKIDTAIRRQLQKPAIRTPHDADVVAAKQQLKEMHAKALQACMDECDNLRQRLADHVEYGEARAEYQQVELFQGS